MQLPLTNHERRQRNIFNTFNHNRQPLLSFVNHNYLPYLFTILRPKRRGCFQQVLYLFVRVRWVSAFWSRSYPTFPRLTGLLHNTQLASLRSRHKVEAPGHTRSRSAPAWLLSISMNTKVHHPVPCRTGDDCLSCRFFLAPD